MQRLVFATGNKDKVRELKEILDGSFEVVSMKELGISPDIDENGETFEENALIKARTLCQLTGQLAVADDSGLVIDALNGEPGVHSARFMGEDTSYTIKNTKLIEMMEGYQGEERSARFVCVIACVFPDGREWTCRGEMEGQIGYEIQGENGFGYDPIFFLPEYGCTSAQLSREGKNEISHRGKAMRMMRDRLQGDRQ
ncbi:MAG: XTP/dITP diphosphatase [Lachnospiraceae bacterium]|nr:XTP/dITP diphosphatase [Lachnospiraceae bacterium]